MPEENSALEEKRQNRRMTLRTQGIALQGQQRLNFTTRDLSVGGSRIEMAVEQAPQVDTPLKVFLQGPGFAADARVRWVRANEHGAAAVGLQFDQFDFSLRARDAFGAP